MHELLLRRLVYREEPDETVEGVPTGVAVGPFDLAEQPSDLLVLAPEQGDDVFAVAPF
jgi:hypothetical protein